MGSVIAMIKMLLAKASHGPFDVVGVDLFQVKGDQLGPPIGSMLLPQEEAKPNAELVMETLNALPQLLRVIDEVGLFIEKREALHQACCGSPLAGRLMREMERIEESLKEEYKELLYPQLDYTPYQKPTEAR